MLCAVPKDKDFCLSKIVFEIQHVLCNCREEIEPTVHFLLHCTFHLVHRNNLLGEVSDILIINVRQLPDDHLCDLLLFGSPTYNEVANKMILDATVSFIIHTKRFK